MQALTRALLEEVAGAAGLGTASIAVLPCTPWAGTRAANLNGEAPIYPASMIKVPLVAAALHEVAAGRILRGSSYAVEARNMTANDAASPLVPGYTAGLDELLELAITRSDNVATNMLFDLVGRERATTIAHAGLGLTATAFHRKLSGSDPLIDDPQWDGIHRNTHPAGDAARLFRAVAERRIPLAEELEGMLERQAWNDKLSLGLRAGDRFAHKTGDTSEVTHDGGILTTTEGHRYAVAVYAPMPSSPENSARFAQFMQQLRALL